MQSELVSAAFEWIAAHPDWMNAVIFVTALAESLILVGIIIPGALMMFTLGALIGLGQVDFWIAWWWSMLGAIAGDTISFWIGRAFHQNIRQVWFFAKHPDFLARSEAFFRKHGGKSVLFGRFFGPVRGTIPTVAGMMDMTWRHFMIANVISAILWAPAYLVPGMVFGASLDIASQVAGRLVMLILIVAALLWLTAWLVTHVVRLVQTHATHWLWRFSSWSQGRRWIAPISASLLDHDRGEVRGLTTLAVLLLGVVILAQLSLSAMGHRLPSGLDLSLFHFFQTLRIPWVDALMVFFVGLGDYQLMLPLSVMVFSCLIWQGNRLAAWHWLAALGFGMATNLLLKGLLPVSIPSEMTQGLEGYSFPSSHTTLSVLVCGFLAALIAREILPSRRWIVYLTASFLIAPIAFARLYLGIHWLTDTLAGLSLGLIWVAILTLAYNHHAEKPLQWQRLLACSVIALLAAGVLSVGFNDRADLQRYQSQTVLHIQSQEQWWTDGWRDLPRQRMNFYGRQRQDFILQWAATGNELESRLKNAGWEPAPMLNLRRMLLWLNPDVELQELPVLPQMHEGREDMLRWVHDTNKPDTRWVLRFWDVGIRLQEGEKTIWVGCMTRQKVESRMGLLTFAVDAPQVHTPDDLLKPAWQGLKTQVVQGRNADAPMTLVADF